MKLAALKKWHATICPGQLFAFLVGELVGVRCLGCSLDLTAARPARKVRR